MGSQGLSRRTRLWCGGCAHDTIVLTTLEPPCISLVAVSLSSPDREASGIECRDKTRDDPTICRHLGEMSSHVLVGKDSADGSDARAVFART